MIIPGIVASQQNSSAVGLPALGASSFNGSTRLQAPGAHTGSFDAQPWTFSVWLKPEPAALNNGRVNFIYGQGPSASTYMLVQMTYNTSTPGWWVTITSRFSNAFRININNLSATGQRIINGQWNHLMFSFNGVGNRNIYVNGVDADTGGGTFANGNHDHSTSLNRIGSRSYTTNDLFEGCMTELYQSQEYIDLSVPANRDKFYQDGKAPDLGANGEIPTGSPPNVYCTGNAADFPTNRGAGPAGPWTVTGSLSDCADAPPRPTPPSGFQANALFWGATTHELQGTLNDTDNKRLTFSVWVNFNVNRASRQFIWSLKGTNNWYCRWDTTGGGNILRVSGTIAGGSTQILRMEYNWTPNLDQWYHLLFSCDLTSTALRHLYIDDTLISPTWVNYVNDPLDYNNLFRLGNRTSDHVGGSISECWLDNSYIDFSVEANRRDFINASGKPVDLGATGSIPTGTSPIIYVNSDAAESTPGYNAGRGPSLTNTGVTDAPTSPSD